MRSGFLDGYPSKYTVIARKTGDKWYGGINGTDKPITVTLNLDMFAGKHCSETFMLTETKAR